MEPLAGEAGFDGDAGGGADAAEGEIGCSPDHCACGVCRKHGPADVIGADVADDPALDHRDGFPAVPDVFSDQGTGGFVVFGDSAALGIEHGVDRDQALAETADYLMTQFILTYGVWRMGCN